MSIKRPKVAQLDAIFATVAKIQRAEARLAALKEQVAQEARALADIPDKRLRIEAGFYAYWFAPEVSATDIALGATGRPHPAKLIKMRGPVSLGIPCERCGEDLPIRSRSQMSGLLGLKIGGHHSRTCIPCQNELQEERLNQRLAECDAWDARQQELAGLSYAEYLQTPEFEESRDLHLWGLADRTHALECETCNADTSLGMYHKSAGEQGGFGDSILLCTSCRDALVAGGKLAGAPCEGNLLPSDLLASFVEAVRAELSY